MRQSTITLTLLAAARNETVPRRHAQVPRIHICQRKLATMACLAVFAAVMSGRIDSATGEVVQDQYYPGHNAAFSLIRNKRQLAQTFPVTVEGWLNHVDVYVNDSNATGEDLLWDIRATVGRRPISDNSNLLAFGVVPAASIPVFPDLTPISLDVSGLNIAVAPGDVLAVTLRTNGGRGFGWRGGTGPPNLGGKFERSGDNLPWDPDTFSPSMPHGFATYVRMIPEPCTFALLGTGALALLAFAWRRRRQAA